MWFGPEESPLFGIVHAPDVPARGTIVVCPPLGHDYAYSHSTFVQLAKRLTLLGFAVLRFDYRSTGDSFDRVPGSGGENGFAADIRSAVEFVRKTGVSQVGVVGMRLGANFVSETQMDPVDAIVLWDPCPTGRSFVRQERALALFAGVRLADEAEALDFPGFKVSAEMATEILDVNLLADRPSLAEEGELSDKVLLLTRPERAPDRNLADRFCMPHVERREVTGQSELLDVYDDWPVVPTEGLGVVAEWLDKVMPRSPCASVGLGDGEVKVAISSDDPTSVDIATNTRTVIRERAVWLGPAGLFGIEAERATGGSGPVCIFVSVANLHRIGPGRLWVPLSRRLALEGFRCVRMDTNGFGDSPARDGQPFQRVHSALAIDDVVDVARAVSPEDPGAVLLFGLCSSGYQILEAALSLSPRGICSLNPSLAFPPPEMASGGAMDPRRRFCMPRGTSVTTPRPQPSVAWLKRNFPRFAFVLAVRQQMVIRGWARFSGRFRDGPGKRLGRLLEAGTEMLLICGPKEIQVFAESGLARTRRADREGRLQIEVVPTLDHGLSPEADRELVSHMIVEFVVRKFREVPLGLAPKKTSDSRRSRVGLEPVGGQKGRA